MASGPASFIWCGPERGRFSLSKRWTWAIFTAILLIAAGLRLYEFEAVPPGLYLDEAADGANAVQAWETRQFKVFYPEDNGREGLYINVSSVFIHFFGSTAWAVRLPAAVFGILTVVGIFALTVELTTPTVALAAAFFLATSYWHVNFSRIAFRAIGAPFFLVWALYFLLLGFRRRLRAPEFAISSSLAGVLYGLGFHTYIAYRITPVLVIVVLSFKFLEAWRGKWMHRYSLAVGLFLATAAVAVYPLLAYLLSHPDMATKRVNEVSILRSEHPSQDLAKNILLTAGMLYWQGDANWRHNYDHRPEVFWPVALFMTIGMAFAIREMLEPASPEVSLPPVLLLLWIVCGAVPAVLSSENVPHALRSILMLPTIAVFAAIGATQSLSVLTRWVSPTKLAAAVILLACALVGETAYTYFHLWARAPQTSAAFDVKNALLARRVNSLPLERTKVVAIQGPSEAADPFFLPLVSLRFLTRSVTLEQQKESRISYYTPLTFPVPLQGDSEANFCADVMAAMPEALVVCLGDQQR